MKIILRSSQLLYKHLVKKILFLIDPEIVHEYIMKIGERLGKSTITKKMLSRIFIHNESALEQTTAGIRFKSPIGLAAGFDYEGKLTQILPVLDFGFQTVGTITNMPYIGNPGRMLGRLPKSKSLMVNKGFKNLGADKMTTKLSRLSFSIPVGISIGKTNTLMLKTQEQSIHDISEAFIKFEKSLSTHSYYELNISCPNLMGEITFYLPKNLDELLDAIDNLHLKKPLFIKMPIDKSDKEILSILEIINTHKVAGVIFGNLQKNRNHPSLFRDEVQKFTTGNFSGKPTFERSNELIKLTYSKYKKRFIIIGCGGVFNARDAYLKMTLGATLIQLITGLIYEGPQLVAQINQDLKKILKKEGYSHISQVIGIKNNATSYK